MADDHNQRAYRSGDVASRSAGSASGNGSSGNDPLAELARLIGQTDPFAEYGRNNAQRAPSVAGAQPEAAWPGEPAYQHAHPAQNDADALYPVDAHAPGYASKGYAQQDYGAQQGYDQAGYADERQNGYEQGFPPSQEPLHDVHQHFGPAPTDDYYDDVAPNNRRRFGVMAIAGVFALGIIGTAGALGYRAVFGPSSVPSTPPVIKAEATPSKVVPASATKEPGKAITDRVAGNGGIERLLSREEQPVAVTTTPNQPPAGASPTMGSGVVGEPKKIRTIQIRPDQPLDASAPPPPTSIPDPAPARVVTTTSIPSQPPAAAPAAQAPRTVTTQPISPQAAAPAPQPVAPPQQAAQPSNAPLSLNPNAPNAAAPARVAARPPAPQPSVAAPAATASTGGYGVQVSAQRSEAEAQAAFQTLQGRYPGQLAGRSPFIKRVDLGDKGIYYRAMVLVGTSGEASELCSSLKAAGGSCIVQRN